LKAKQKSPSETIAEVFTSFVQLSYNDQEKQSALSKVLGADIQNYISVQSKKKKIEMLEKQIEVLQRKLQSSSCEEQCARYRVGFI
jgi:transcriptional regulatory protein LevR